MHGGSVSRTEAWRAECRRHPARNAAVSAAGTGGERDGGQRAYRDGIAARRLTLLVHPATLPAGAAPPPWEPARYGKGGQAISMRTLWACQHTSDAGARK